MRWPAKGSSAVRSSPPPPKVHIAARPRTREAACPCLIDSLISRGSAWSCAPSHRPGGRLWSRSAHESGQNLTYKLRRVRGGTDDNPDQRRLRRQCRRADRQHTHPGRAQGLLRPSPQAQSRRSKLPSWQIPLCALPIAERLPALSVPLNEPIADTEPTIRPSQAALFESLVCRKRSKIWSAANAMPAANRQQAADRVQRSRMAAPIPSWKFSRRAGRRSWAGSPD